MPRSLQLDNAAAAAAAAAATASTTSMTAAASPWKRSTRTGRPTAASFSAGDFRNQHQHMLAFEQQIDAIVGGAESTSQYPQQHQQHVFSSSEMEQLVRGSLERSVSTSSSVGFAAGSQSGASDTKGSLRLNVGSKITGRRHRTPRRFVVTDIPDFDEFNHTSAAKSGHSNDDAVKSLAGSQPRQGKTEVKGRFTIIDLSPDSPQSSPRAQRSPPPEAGSRHGSRHGASPRRRVLRKPANQNARSEFPTTPSKVTQHQVMYMDPVDSAAKSRRVDLNVFDRHLDYLQKESAGMKSLLEGMVSTNARWINALGQAGVTFHDEQISGSSQCADALVPNVAVPTEPDPPPSVGSSSVEEKFAAMELAYMELQKKHELLLATNKHLEEQNATLETRLQQQSQISEDLRAQLQHLSQCADNLVSDSDPSNDYASDLMSMFGDQSSVEVEDQSPSGAEFSTDYEYPYELSKNPLFRRRRRRYSEDEECMSDTSSEGSMSKSRSRMYDDEDNNFQFNDSTMPSDEDVVAESKAYRLTANRVEHYMFERAEEPASTLESMMLDQASQLRRSLQVPSASHGAEPMAVDAVESALPTLNDLRSKQPSNNQLAHAVGPMFAVLKRNDSLTSILLNNYSTVSSNSSIASIGVQIAALTKTQSGTFVTASGTRLGVQASTSNQQLPGKTEYTSLSSENLFFHNNLAFGKGPSSFGFDPHEDPSFGEKMVDGGAARDSQLSPQTDLQFSHH